MRNSHLVRKVSTGDESLEEKTGVGSHHYLTTTNVAARDLRSPLGPPAGVQVRSALR